jgi:hypothetical protein
MHTTLRYLTAMTACTLSLKYTALVELQPNQLHSGDVLWQF